MQCYSNAIFMTYMQSYVYIGAAGLYDIEEAQVKGNPLYVADEIYDILAEMSKIED